MFKKRAVIITLINKALNLPCLAHMPKGSLSPVCGWHAEGEYLTSWGRHGFIQTQPCAVLRGKSHRVVQWWECPLIDKTRPVCGVDLWVWAAKKRGGQASLKMREMLHCHCSGGFDQNGAPVPNSSWIKTQIYKNNWIQHTHSRDI